MGERGSFATFGGEEVRPRDIGPFDMFESLFAPTEPGSIPGLNRLGHLLHPGPALQRRAKESIESSNPGQLGELRTAAEAGDLDKALTLTANLYPELRTSHYRPEDIKAVLQPLVLQAYENARTKGPSLMPEERVSQAHRAEPYLPGVERAALAEAGGLTAYMAQRRGDQQVEQNAPLVGAQTAETTARANQLVPAQADYYRSGGSRLGAATVAPERLTLDMQKARDTLFKSATGLVAKANEGGQPGFDAAIRPMVDQINNYGAQLRARGVQVPSLIFKPEKTMQPDPSDAAAAPREIWRYSLSNALPGEDDMQAPWGPAPGSEGPISTNEGPANIAPGAFAGMFGGGPNEAAMPNATPAPEEEAAPQPTPTAGPTAIPRGGIPPLPTAPQLPEPTPLPQQQPLAPVGQNRPKPVGTPIAITDFPEVTQALAAGNKTDVELYDYFVNQRGMTAEEAHALVYQAMQQYGVAQPQ